MGYATVMEYSCEVSMIKPISSNLFKPLVDDVEYFLRPAMVSLTWTSMNIDQFIHGAFEKLNTFEQLVLSVNDIMESRITLYQSIIVELYKNINLLLFQSAF